MLMNYNLHGEEYNRASRRKAKNQSAYPYGLDLDSSLSTNCIDPNEKEKLPRGLPILGHFHMLGKNLHQDIAKKSEKNPPHYHVNVRRPSSHHSEPFLKTYDHFFYSRSH